VLYNETASSKNNYTMMMGVMKASAYDCVGCRACEKRCPQGIEITKYIDALKGRYAE